MAGSRAHAYARAPMNSMYPKKLAAQQSPRSLPQTAPAAASKRRIEVRRSGIHGKGVFAVRPIAKGERVIEYTGKMITWKQAQRAHPHDPDDPNHTFYFHIDDKH